MDHSGEVDYINWNLILEILHPKPLWSQSYGCDILVHFKKNQAGKNNQFSAYCVNDNWTYRCKQIKKLNGIINQILNARRSWIF